jgi:hypothetical protein
MSTFILVTLSLDYHILLPVTKNIMSMSLSTLGGLGTLGTDALTKIYLIKILLIWLIQD